jgi:oxygen-independent coproporphyrinogen-3 oxidase
LPLEKENLGEVEKYNEFIMLSLRTRWGIEKAQLEQFSAEIQNYFKDKIAPMIQSRNIEEDSGRYYLSVDSWYLSDDISSQLFL